MGSAKKENVIAISRMLEQREDGLEKVIVVCSSRVGVH